MDNPYDEIDEKSHADRFVTRAEWFTVVQVGELLGMTEDAVVAACESGALDSRWNVLEDRTRAYYVFHKEVSSYRIRGPRQIMNFVEAIRMVDDGKLVKRACWNGEFVKLSMFSDEDELKIYCKWTYDEGDDPAYWRGEAFTEHQPWLAKEADKAATDWVNHDRPYGRYS